MKPLPKAQRKNQQFVYIWLPALVLLLPFPTISWADRHDLFTPLVAGTGDLTETQQSVLAKIKNEKSTSRVEVVRLNAGMLKGNVADMTILPHMAIRAPIKERKGTFSMLTNKVVEPDYQPESEAPRASRRSGPGESSVLVVRNNSITGTVNSDEGVYEIRPLGNGLHAIVTIDETKLPPEHPPSFTELEKKQVPEADIRALRADRHADKSKTKTQVIDVLVAYTAKVKAATADVEGLIQLAIEETNRSYTKSKIKARLRLVKTHGVKYVESDSIETDLTRLREKKDGFMDDVHALRKKHGADIVILLVDNAEYCGLASDILAKAGTAFAVVYYSCATGYYSFAHEIGHLQGARHNAEADNSSTPFPYAHGFQYKSQWRTVMSYDCPSGCTRKDVWSNPKLPGADPSLHDNARVLNETAPVMAGFVQSSVP